MALPIVQPRCFFFSSLFLLQQKGSRGASLYCPWLLASLPSTYSCFGTSSPKDPRAGTFKSQDKQAKINKYRNFPNHKAGMLLTAVLRLRARERGRKNHYPLYTLRCQSKKRLARMTALHPTSINKKATTLGTNMKDGNCLTLSKHILGGYFKGGVNMLWWQSPSP